MEKYRKLLAIVLVISTAFFIDNFSTYLCFYYIPGSYETHPTTSALISKLGPLLGLIIYQIIAMFLLVIVIFLIGSIKYESKLNSKKFVVIFFILIAAVILIHICAAAHNFIILTDFLTF